MTVKRQTVKRLLFISQDPDWPWTLGTPVYWVHSRKTFTIQRSYNEPMTFVGIVSHEPVDLTRAASILVLGSPPMLPAV